MRASFIIAFILCIVTPQFAQVIAPDRMEFAGIQLTFTPDARLKIQDDVNKIRKNATYFNQMVAKADEHFPVIEEIFNEEHLPTDFKYLIIQESSFRPDAVSSSNAVGYWQFKKESATEVGMRVDNDIDERKNIAQSSRGAAKYITKNNAKVNNWVYALLAYNVGPGGVLMFVDQKYVGAKEMEITGGTHWYVLKFLAHMIAYRNEVGKNASNRKLHVHYTEGGHKLKDVSKKFDTQYDDFIQYNKWIDENKEIPTDKTYAVIVPLGKDASVGTSSGKKPTPSDKKTPQKDSPKTAKKSKKDNNTVTVSIDKVGLKITFSMNGIEAIEAKEGDNSQRLAIKGGISKEAFLKYNDLKSFEEVVPGQAYYLKPKKNKAKVAFHTVQEGETIWQVSQKYGISIAAIRKKNGLKKNEALATGRVLWLRKKRPKDQPIEIKETPKPKPVPAPTPVAKPEPVVIKKAVEEPKPTPIQPVVPGTKEHVVTQGQTLYSIARMYQASVEDIKKWNALATDELTVGQTIQVQPSEPMNLPEKPTTHVVKVGDTLYSIARTYGITVSELKQLNAMTTDALSLGQELRVK